MSMRSLREWRDGIEEYSNPEQLVEKINDLANKAIVELESFIGERPEGFLDLCGAVKELKRRVLEIQHGVESPKWQTQECAGSKPKAPRGMKKLCHKEVKPSGTRLATDDLSKDYKGNIAQNGEVEPFSIAKKQKAKNVAPVA